MNVTINPTYKEQSAFMREVSWRDLSGEFCWKVTCSARNVRQVLDQLITEFGSIVVIRKPQENVWKAK